MVLQMLNTEDAENPWRLVDERLSEEIRDNPKTTVKVIFILNGLYDINEDRVLASLFPKLTALSKNGKVEFFLTE